MSIFGISLIDNFFEFISNFFNEIRVIASSITSYLSETQFYSYITGLFYNKEVPTSTKTGKSGSMIGENSNETKGISGKIEQNNGNSKISE
jgi:hypothetical protein